MSTSVSVTSSSSSSTNEKSSKEIGNGSNNTKNLPLKENENNDKNSILSTPSSTSSASDDSNDIVAKEQYDMASSDSHSTIDNFIGMIATNHTDTSSKILEDMLLVHDDDDYVHCNTNAKCENDIGIINNHNNTSECFVNNIEENEIKGDKRNNEESPLTQSSTSISNIERPRNSLLENNDLSSSLLSFHSAYSSCNSLKNDTNKGDERGKLSSPSTSNQLNEEMLDESSSVNKVPDDDEISKGFEDSFLDHNNDDIDNMHDTSSETDNTENKAISLETKKHETITSSKTIENPINLETITYDDIVNHNNDTSPNNLKKEHTSPIVIENMFDSVQYDLNFDDDDLVVTNDDQSDVETKFDEFLVLNQSQQVNQERNEDSEYNEAEISSHPVINSVDNVDGQIDRVDEVNEHSKEETSSFSSYIIETITSEDGDSDIDLEETTQKPGEKEYETKSSMYTYDDIVKKNEERISLAKSKSLIKMFDSEKFDLKFSDEDESIGNVSTNSKKSNNANNDETKTETIHEENEYDHSIKENASYIISMSEVKTTDSCSNMSEIDTASITEAKSANDIETVANNITEEVNECNENYLDDAENNVIDTKNETETLIEKETKQDKSNNNPTINNAKRNSCYSNASTVVAGSRRDYDPPSIQNQPGSNNKIESILKSESKSSSKKILSINTSKRVSFFEKMDSISNFEEQQQAGEQSYERNKNHTPASVERDIGNDDGNGKKKYTRLSKMKLIIIAVVLFAIFITILLGVLLSKSKESNQDKNQDQALPTYESYPIFIGNTSLSSVGSFVSISNTNTTRVALAARTSNGLYTKIFILQNDNNNRRLRYRRNTMSNEWTTYEVPTSKSQGLTLPYDGDDTMHFINSMILSTDGNHLAISSSYYVSQAQKTMSYVQVYSYEGKQWAPMGDPIVDIDNNDESLSLSLSDDGTVLAIGASKFSSVQRGTYVGNVCVFEYVESIKEWRIMGNDCLLGGLPGDEMGKSVSLSKDGNTLAIGTWRSYELNGHVAIYKLDGSAWVQIGNNIVGEQPGDKAGISVSLSGDGTRVAFGSANHDGEGTITNSGQCSIYQYSGNTWLKLGSSIIGEYPGNMLGSVVSLVSNGTIVSIASSTANKVDTSSDGRIITSNYNGFVAFYEYDGSDWKEMAFKFWGENEGDHCGVSLSLAEDGRHVAVGCPGEGRNVNPYGYISFINL